MVWWNFKSWISLLEGIATTRFLFFVVKYFFLIFVQVFLSIATFGLAAPFLLFGNSRKSIEIVNLFSLLKIFFEINFIYFKSAKEKQYIDSEIPSKNKEMHFK
jgi:hypothetical protein